MESSEYAVVVLMMVVSTAIGIYYRLTGGRQRTVDEYLLADRNMGVVPVAISLVVSFMSAVTILGYASENYTYGTQFVALNVAYVVGVPIVAFVYLPVFFRMRLTSVYEYLQRRFGRSIRVAASVVFHLQMVLYMSVVLYAPALAISAATGLSKWSSVVSLGVVCTFYSTIGGMKAVLWTDVFQGMLIFAAVVAVLLRGFLAVDAPDQVYRVVSDRGRLEFFNTRLDPTVRHTFWTQAVGGIFTFTSIYGVNQAQIQRLLTVGDLKMSQMSLFLCWPFLTAVNLMISLCGLLIYYHYRDCDPLTSGRVISSDQLMPLFVMDFLSGYRGIPGLFVSGIFSATLSTVSSALNSLAAVTLEDYLKPSLKRQWSDARQAFISKVLVLLYGVVCMSLTFVAEQLGGVLQASFIVFGVVGGPLLGLFSLGMFTTRANEKGAMCGFFLSLGIVSWIGFGAAVNGVAAPKLPLSVSGCNVTIPLQITNSSEMGDDYFNFSNDTSSSITTDLHRNDHVFYLYRVSYMWLSAIGFFLVMVIGWSVSIVQKEEDVYVDPVLLSPPFRYFHGIFDGTSSFKVKEREWDERRTSHKDTETKL